MYRIRRCVLALLTALVCVMPTYSWASASEDPLLDFVKVVAPEAISGSTEAAPAPAVQSEQAPLLQKKEDDDSEKKDLVERIADKWRKSPKAVRDIVRYAYEHAYSDFPQPIHILAIIAVESAFDPSAVSRKNVGLMQINLPANGKKLRNRSMQENIRVGAGLLNEYFNILKRDRRGAVLSYNAGIGNYLNGRYTSRYWSKYQKELHWLSVKQ